ncbi:MAG: hypothetical protein KFF73_12125, partial [Cyclobacteriaceae bacterium]|nr:hypothetical protein [Cyclobacteriaceae bacterium]
MVYRYPILLLLIPVSFFIAGCELDYTITCLESDSPHIRYTGRINQRNKKAPVIYWSGSEIEINFKGDSLKILLEDERGGNYFNIVLNGDSLRYIRLDSGNRSYLLAAGLQEKVHKIEVIKRTEWDRGHTVFHGFELVNGSFSAPDKGNGRVIEFFGNSITAGYAIEDDTGGDSPDSIFTNNYTTYGAITARHFKADYIGTVRSGIG